eukprot:7203554-Prymnesium_polylepis.1
MGSRMSGHAMGLPGVAVQGGKASQRRSIVYQSCTRQEARAAQWRLAAAAWGGYAHQPASTAHRWPGYLWLTS